MRAGLDGQREPLGAGLGQHRQGVGRGQVDDVDATSRLAAECDQEPDRVVLPFPRARGEVSRVAAAVFARRRIGGGDRGRARQLGVDQEGEADQGEPGQDGAEVGLGRVGELVDPRVQRNALKPSTPAARRASTWPSMPGTTPP